MPGNNEVIDIPIGTHFGWLTVKARNGSRWHCQCACGTIVIIKGNDLRNGRKSCGCKLQQHLLRHNGGRLKLASQLDEDENAYGVE